MKKHLPNLGGMLLAGLIYASGGILSAQRVTVTETTTRMPGTASESAPAWESLMVRTETSTEPVRYLVTKKTMFVDESGTPLEVTRITPGLPVVVHFLREGDRFVASRIVV